jgi:hypothetical protein
MDGEGKKIPRDQGGDVTYIYQGTCAKLSYCLRAPKPRFFPEMEGSKFALEQMQLATGHKHMIGGAPGIEGLEQLP